MRDLGRRIGPGATGAELSVLVAAPAQRLPARQQGAAVLVAERERRETITRATAAAFTDDAREIAQRTLARDFRRFDPATARVVLLDAQERVLQGFPEPLSRRARAMLERRCVEVRTCTRVTGLDVENVTSPPTPGARNSSPAATSKPQRRRSSRATYHSRVPPKLRAGRSSR